MNPPLMSGQFNDISVMHKMYVNQHKLSNSKQELLKKDVLPPTRKFTETKDNGVVKLHPARWLRMPFADPKDYYHLIPVMHEKRYRSLALEFSGNGSTVPDKTIMMMHDRRNPLEIKHFMKENCSVASKPMKEIRRKEDEELVTISDYNWTEPQFLRQVKHSLNY